MRSLQGEVASLGYLLHSRTAWPPAEKPCLCRSSLLWELKENGMHLPVGVGGKLFKGKIVPDVGTVTGKSTRHPRLHFNHSTLSEICDLV